MTSLKVILADYHITPSYLVYLAGEYSGQKLITVRSGDRPDSIEFTFDGPSAAANAKHFRDTLDSTFARKAA